ncbi:MAG: type II secretion system minor pseudopilin GspK [Leucothrix sp.]
MTVKQHRFQYNAAPSKQSGAALLIALVIMTISIGIAANIMFRQQLHTRLASNISHLEQAYPYATALEDYARTILTKDFEDAPESDNLGEVWATKTPPVPIPGGTMEGQLFDLQSKLNLNNLYPPEKPIEENPEPPAPGAPPPPPPTPEELKLIKDQDRYIIAQQRITRLIKTIDPEETLGPAANFADTVQDWIDEDNDTSVGGVESDYYQSLDPAYNTANSFLVNETELRLLKDVDTDVYKLLQPHLTPLPEYTPVNVNTASMDVIQALGFTPEAAENIISVRDEEPFESMENFLSLAVVSAATQSTPDTEPEVYEQDLSVTSKYFLLQGEVNIGTARLYINSILYRNDGKVTVVSRDFSNQQIKEAKQPEE